MRRSILISPVLGALAFVSSAVYADDAELEPAIEEQGIPEEVAAEPPPDDDPRAGYIPGYKGVPNLSLSTLSPQTSAFVGNTTIPFYAPSGAEEWQFKFTGFASAALRLSMGERDDTSKGQHQRTIHAPPRMPDSYGAFGGTNVTPGSWTDLHFQYGNGTVQAHVTLTTWKPGLAADYTDIRSQNLIDQAFLHYGTLIGSKSVLTATVGAFRNSYGGLGQYGAGQYNTFIIGMPWGVGGTLNMSLSLSSSYSLQVEHGVMGKLGKVPVGSGPSPFDAVQTSARPSAFVHHLHVGLAKSGEIPFVLSLHYLNNWSQDETDQVDDPKTYWVDEGVRPDGKMQVLGLDLRMMENYWGNFALALAWMDARDAALLTGMGFFGATSGEEVTKRFLGQVGGGTGSMLVGGLEYTLSWAKLLYHPKPFGGDRPDLITSVFSNVGLVNGKDPQTDGRRLVKFGGEVTYQFISWAGLSGRYDHVIPDSNDESETFDAMSAKLLFRTQWITHEQVTVSYTRWLYGSGTHTEFPYELPRDELDEHMFALHFGMWW